MTLVGLQSVALASASDEAGFLDKINQARSAAGLAPLVMDESLRAYARDHSQFQADGKCPDKDGQKKKICHYSADPGQDAKFKAAAGSGWSRLGENVGVGSSVDSLHAAFMNSAGHKKNILGDYNYVGIGVVKTNQMYVTVAFMKKGSTPSPTTTTTQPKPTTTKPAPKPTTTKPAPKPTTTVAKPSTTTTEAPSTTTTTEAPSTTTTTMGPTTTTTMPTLFVLHASGMTLFEWVVDVFGPAMWCNDLTRRHWSCID